MVSRVTLQKRHTCWDSDEEHTFEYLIFLGDDGYVGTVALKDSSCIATIKSDCRLTIDEHMALLEEIKSLKEYRQIIFVEWGEDDE